MIKYTMKLMTKINGIDFMKIKNQLKEYNI